ncbi:hypothetical protein QTJ16_005474 [Diplocarpon rosae]|uniref:Ima1 N-terminal domain-containing protein n=1 Tax=Diplocarpon rosae TaxID=946125 RepID=A0AAD9SWS6_9HELO|nr:hypothetical protein QTJ16_005474 [Diplocarpon rosae]
MSFLICFYCNMRSGIRFDGCMTQWDCAQCDATNFLDANGDIADPVVSSEVAPPDLRFSTTRPESGSKVEDTLFCATCLKNQHLYTRSIAQYEFDTATRRINSVDDERKYNNWKRSLERRYPQVCEACEPKVVEQIRRSAKITKTDHLRRLLDKSRANRALQPPKVLLLPRIIIFIGRILWYFGIFGQLLWNITAVLSATYPGKLVEFLATTRGYSSVPISAVLSLLNSNAWARCTLLSSVLSCWWCPRLNDAPSDFAWHYTGYRRWCGVQLLLVAIRSLFYYNMGLGMFVNPHTSGTVGAHTVMCFLVTFLFFGSYRSVKLDKSPLWSNMPDKLPFLDSDSGSNSTPHGKDTMEDLVFEIGRENREPSSQPPRGFLSPTSTPSNDSPTQSSYKPQGHADQATNAQLHRRQNMKNPQYQRELYHDRPSTPPEDVRTALTRDRPLLSEMTTAEGILWLSTKKLPARFEDKYGPNKAEEMDWVPTVPQKTISQPFNAPQPPQHETQSFGETPVGGQTSPFWFKVPPAPITPAHRLRNPPNQPQFKAPSKEARSVFTAGRSALTNVPSRSEDMAQQRLFFDEKPSEGEEALAGMMGSFSIAETQRESEMAWTVYLGLALALGAALLYIAIACTS